MAKAQQASCCPDNRKRLPTLLHARPITSNQPGSGGRRYQLHNGCPMPIDIIPTQNTSVLCIHPHRLDAVVIAHMPHWMPSEFRIMSKMAVSRLLQSFQFHVDSSSAINDIPMIALFHQRTKHKRAQKRHKILIILILLKCILIKYRIQLKYTA